MQNAQTDNELSSRAHTQTNTEIETPTTQKGVKSQCVCLSVCVF